MKSNVVITVDNYGQDFSKEIKALKDAGFDVVWKPLDVISSVDRIIENVRGFDFVIAGGELWNKDAISGVKDKMKMITRFGVGYDKVDIDTATKLGIAVSNTPGRNAAAVAEHALALMLGLSRTIVKYDREIRRGLWKSALSAELFGKTVGLVGFGAISKELAKLLKVFTNEILAYDVYKDEHNAKELGVKFVELDELLKEADFVSIHVPLMEETIGMVDKQFLEKMRPSAYLINTSRGKIIEENALIEVLQKGKIAGAGLDVFENQPLTPESPLVKLENVILTPHAASTNQGGFRGMMEGAVENIIEFNAGKKVKYILNPKYEDFLKNK